MADSSLPSSERVNPGALTVADAARLLSAAGGRTATAMAAEKLPGSARIVDIDIVAEGLGGEGSS